MAQTVIMPKLGQTVEESTIVKWHKREGEPVKKGEVLFEIETDKAVLEIESFFEGTLLKIVTAEGQTVPVTAPVAFIGRPGEPIPDTPLPAAEQRKETKPAATSESLSVAPIHRPLPVRPVPQSVPIMVQPARKAVSPRARKMAEESAINWEPISGTGPGGRVTEKDILSYLEEKKYNELQITPAAKALAIKEKIDALAVEGESPGRISVEDIQRAAAEKPVEMSKMRQVIAQRLTKSFTSIPHFYVTTMIDMTGLLDFRKKLKGENKPYPVTDFILKACATALKEFPAVNSAIEGENGKAVKWHSRVHIGLAVEVKEGLVVPVIRNADRISLRELHEHSKALVLKAREGKLTPAEMSGGTFTVSNLGMLNVENFTAIINPGESAILAVASITPAAMVVEGQITVRAIMKVTVSADHRIVDGALAARFVNRVKVLLEDLKTWVNI